MSTVDGSWMEVGIRIRETRQGSCTLGLNDWRLGYKGSCKVVQSRWMAAVDGDDGWVHILCITSNPGVRQ